jgi:LmbE family N-acetylglucosaminyl deacetylase
MNKKSYSSSSPHTDDEIGCGATIAKHIKNGDEVVIVIATNASIGAQSYFEEHS